MVVDLLLGRGRVEGGAPGARSFRAVRILAGARTEARADGAGAGVGARTVARARAGAGAVSAAVEADVERPASGLGGGGPAVWTGALSHG